MKKTIIFISITILTLFIFLSFTIQQDKFVGTWINNKDQLWKITFTNDGHRKDYYENVLTDTYSYSISNTCNNEVSQDVPFLKTIDNQNNVSCDIINGFHTDDNGITTMSLTSERGKLYLFTKQ